MATQRCLSPGPPPTPSRTAERRSRARQWADAYARLTEADRVGAARARRPRAGSDGRVPRRPRRGVGRSPDPGLRRGASGGDVDRAARRAFWIGFGLLFRGEPVRGGGWLARAARHADEAGRDSRRARVPAGAPALGDHEAGNFEAAAAAFREAARIANLHADADLATIARLGLGDALIGLGQVLTRRRPARRGDGGGDGGRGVADRHGHRLLRRDRDLPADLRSRPRPRVDGRAGRLVRRASRPRAVPRRLPRLSRRPDDAPRRLAGGARRGPARLGRVAASQRGPGRGRGRLPARRAAPAARRGSRGGGGVSGRQPAGAGAAAGPRAAAARRRARSRGGGRDPASGRCVDGFGRAPRLLDAFVEIALAAGHVASAGAAADELATLAGRPRGAVARGARRPGRGLRPAGRGRGGERARRAAAGARRVAGARGALRGGARADARRPGVPRGSATTTPPTWSSMPRAACSGTSAQPRPCVAWRPSGIGERPRQSRPPAA